MVTKAISRRRRNRLASGLRRAVDAAAEPPRAFSAAVPLARDQVLAEGGLLLQLADELESDEWLEPRGIALVERLLTDGDSPTYAPSPPGSLHAALTHAHAALHLS